MNLESNYILIYRQFGYDDEQLTAAGDEVSLDLDKTDIPMQLKRQINTQFQLSADSWSFKEKLYRQEAGTEFEFDGIKAQIHFEIFRVPGKNYLNIFVNAGSRTKGIRVQEEINRRLFTENTELNSHYIVVISNDPVSGYYCEKAFARLAGFERLFRRLLFNIYLLNYGNEYYARTMDEAIVAKAKGNIRGNKKNKEERYLKEFFYSLDYNDIQEILFGRQWTSVEEQYRDSFLASNEDLGKLSDHELRSFVSELRPKSDWERLFSQTMDAPDIYSDINYIREQRNKVAHSKFYGEKDYQETNAVVQKLIKAVEKAIALTQEQDFTQKNQQLARTLAVDTEHEISRIREKLGSELPAGL